MALASAFVAGYGIIQYAGWDPLVWSEKTSFPDGRIISTLGQPNFLAHFLVLVIPVSVFLFKFSAGRVKRFLLAGLILVQVLALVFTFSRAGWLALAAGMFLALAGVFLILKRKRALYILSAAAVVAVIAVLGLNVWSSTPSWEDSGLSDNPFLSRAAGIANPDQGSTRMRIYYWQASWEEFWQASLTRKLVGYGPDTLGNIFAGHYEKDWGIQESLNTYPNRAHNFFFDTLLSFGLVGVAAGVLFFGYILLQAVRYLKTGREQRGEEYWLVFTLFIIVMIHAANNFFSFSNATTYVYFYTFLGILATLIFKKEKEIKLNISRISAVAIIAALTVFSAIFIVFYNIDLVRADREYIEARKIMAEEGSDPRKKCFFAINGINSAIELNTVHNFYKKEYLRLSLNCFSEFVLARPKVKENMLYEIRSDSRQERNYDLDLYTARVYSLLAKADSSYYGKAEEVYRDLIEFNPYMTTPYKELARLKLQHQEAGGAVSVLKKGIEVTPSPQAPYASREHKREAGRELGRLYELLGRAYEAQEKESLAGEAYQKALDLNSSFDRQP